MSAEQGIYVAEAVASKNTKLAKGRFRAYDVQDEVIFVLTSCGAEMSCRQKLMTSKSLYFSSLCVSLLVPVAWFSVSLHLE